MLTQKVVEGELVIVPDLEYHSCWDFALSLVQPPESILAQRRSREGSKKERLERGSGPFRPGRLPGGGSGVGHLLGTCQSQVLAGRLMRPQRAGSLHTGGSFNPPNSVMRLPIPISQMMKQRLGEVKRLPKISQLIITTILHFLCISPLPL